MSTSSDEPREPDDADRALLSMEEDWQLGRVTGDKEALIRDRLGISSPRYHQRLNELLDDADAARFAPGLIGRLRRVREERRRARSASNL